MEIDLVGPLLESNGFTHILTEIDVFSRYLFAVPLRRRKQNQWLKDYCRSLRDTRMCPDG